MASSIPNPKPVVDRAIAALDINWLASKLATAPDTPSLGPTIWVDSAGIVHFSTGYAFLRPNGDKYLRPGGFDYLRTL